LQIFISYKFILCYMECYICCICGAEPLKRFSDDGSAQVCMTTGTQLYYLVPKEWYQFKI